MMMTMLNDENDDSQPLLAKVNDDLTETMSQDDSSFSSSSLNDEDDNNFNDSVRFELAPWQSSSPRAVSFASAAHVHPIESIHDLDAESKSERWYSSAQLRMIQDLTQITAEYMQKLHPQINRSSSISEEEEDMDVEEVFCATGLGYAMSEQRREQRYMNRVRIVRQYHHQQHQFHMNTPVEDLAALYQKLSRESVEQARSSAEELRAEVTKDLMNSLYNDDDF